MALAERAELVARLSLKDDFSAKLRGATKSVQGLDKAFSRTQTSLSKTGQNIARLGAVLGAAAVGGFIAVVKAAGDFEAQLNTINTIARASPAALGKIGDSIRQIARDTGTPLEDLTQGYYDLLSAGIKAADAAKVLTAANTLAIGGLSTTAQAVDLLTTAINVYGGDATKAGAYADIFAKAVERGKVTADEIAASFSQVGNIAASSGLEITELAAGYARLTAGGTAAAEVSTQMRSAIVALTKRTPDLEKLEKATKKNYLAIAGDKGLVYALEIMRKDADKAKVPLIDLLGRVEGLNFTLATTGPNFAAYNADLAAMGDAAGTAAGQMGERQKGLNFALDRLKALALDAGITLGSALLPKLVPLVEKLNDLISGNQGKIAAFGTSLASGFEQVATALGKVDWQPFIDGLRLSSDIAKSTIGIFRSLPEGLQAALVGGFALNKVTGGLGTSIVKDLGGILLKQFAGRGSTPANPLWVASVTGGGGVPGVPIGGKGAALAGLISKVFVVGMLASVADDIQTALGSNYDPAKNLPLNQLSWPWGPKNTPKVDFGPWTNILGGDSSLPPAATVPVAETPGSRANSGLAETPGSRANAGAHGLLAASLAALTGRIAKSDGLSPDERQVAYEQRTATNRIYDALERNRLAKQTLNVTVNVSTSVTVRDYVRQARISTKYGLVAS